MSNFALSTSANNSVAYVNGKIWTVNDAQSIAEAFVVSPDGHFSAVGSNADILDTARRDGLTVFDLHNRFVMPGMHDAHTHFMIAGLAQLNETKLGPDVSGEDFAAKLRDGQCACHYTNVYGDWLVANMYYNHSFPDSKPDRKYLDGEFPDTPIMVRGGACHALLVNTAGLETAGYTVAGEDDAQGTRYVRRDDGTLTGELFEKAMGRAMLALPKPAFAHIKRALRHAQTLAHRAGITSCQEASATTAMLHALRELDNEGLLKLDFATHIAYNMAHVSGEHKNASRALIDGAASFQTKHVDTRFVKMIIDGVPLPPLFTQCSLDEHGKPEMDKITTDDFREAVLEYDAKDFTCKIHCSGTGSTRLALDAFEEARQRHPDGPRHEIAHCSGVHDDEYKRFRALNVTAEMSPAMFFTHAVTKESQLMDWNFPKMRDAGAHVTIGSDWGVPPSPELLPYMADLIEDLGGGSKEKGAQMVCRMLTCNGAEAVGKEKETGSIEVGKRANFIVVDKDLSKGEFEGAKVLGTWFEGELVWDDLL